MQTNKEDSENLKDSLDLLTKILAIDKKQPSKLMSRKQNDNKQESLKKKGSNQDNMEVMNEKKLIMSLTYGRSMQYYDDIEKQVRDLVLYFHESSQQILMAIDKQTMSQIALFNVKKINMDVSNYKLNTQRFLQNRQYLVVEQGIDKIILIFQTQIEKLQFYTTAKQVIKKLSNKKTHIDCDVIKCFIKTDKNKNFIIDFSELQEMLRMLKIQDQETINHYLAIAKEQNKYENITFRDFQRLARLCMCRREFLGIFQKWCGTQLKNYHQFTKPVMSKQVFQKFVHQVQDQQKQIAEKIAKNIFQNMSQISFFQFCIYLGSSTNNIQSDTYEKVKINMDLPLNNYYIHSSHNTYLTGSQFNSNSRAERYFEDLQAGIRCVQIDCYDDNRDVRAIDLDRKNQEQANKKKTQFQQIRNIRKLRPIVKHGQTITKQIQFESVIKQIEKFCRLQKYNHTPIIISIQNHCSNQNQLEMANILEQYFGDRILKIKQQKQNNGDDYVFQNSNMFIESKQQKKKGKRSNLTLGSLMGRIIIKCTGNFKMYKQILLEKGNQTLVFSKDSKINCTVMKVDQMQSQEQGEQFESQIIASVSNVSQNKIQTSQSLDLNKTKQNKLKADEGEKQALGKKKNEKKKRIPQAFQKDLMFFDSRIAYYKAQKQMFAKKAMLIMDFAKNHYTKRNVKDIKKVINIELLKLTSMLASGSLGKPDYWQSVSLSQDRIISYNSQEKKKIIMDHTKVGWIRAYPKSVRNDSSNFNPFPSIQMGIQIIAINTQNNDYPNLLMRKFFEKGIQNIKGYRQRINYLQLKGRIKQKEQMEPKTIYITPLSASKISYNDLSLNKKVPPVRVRMRAYCYSGDFDWNLQIMQWKYYTQQVKNNAYNPIFTSEQTMTINYTCQQLTFVMFQIQQCGIGIIPIERIKKGYRYALMYNNQGMVKSSKVFFSVGINKPLR